MFDAVGTLIYPDPPVAVAYHDTGKHHGSQLTQDEIKQNFGLAITRHSCPASTSESIERERWKLIVADVFADLSNIEPLFAQLWDHFARPTSWAVFDDVAETFAKLQSKGIKIAIGSNFDDRLFPIAAALPPLDRVANIFVSSQIGFTKPETQFFRGVENALHLAPHELLMVGDDPQADFNGATTASWHSVLLRRGTPCRQTHEINSLVELLSS